MILAFPLSETLPMLALLELKSPKTSPKNSSGVVTSTYMIGSKITGSACLTDSCKAIEEAIWKAISEESTS